MRVAALDLGSNTFLCLIAEIEQGIVQSIIDDQVRIVRLGQGLKAGGDFHPEALERAENCLKYFSELIEKHRPDKIVAVATAAARNAKNGIRLLELGEKFNIPIQIIAGDVEARITYEGGLSTFKDSGHYLLIDIGGGSTEIIYGSREVKQLGHSFDFGVVKLTEAFVSGKYPISDDVKKSIKTAIKAQIGPWLSAILGRPLDRVVAVAGTPTSLVAMELGKFDASKIDGFVFQKSRLDNWIETLGGLTPLEIQKNYGLDLGRADVITAGAIILSTILEVLELNSFTVSTRGVRFGAALAAERGEL